MNLIATFPKDRTQMGILEVFRNGSLVVPAFPCYGKADDAMAKQKGNPTRNPLLPFGDTPTGIWRVRVGIVQRDTKAYGPYQVFMLWPLSGDAFKAYGPLYRRNGIWLHSGDLNAAGGLRPTNGCPRTHNETMFRLHELSAQYGSIDTLETKEA